MMAGVPVTRTRSFLETDSRVLHEYALLSLSDKTVVRCEFVRRVDNTLILLCQAAGTNEMPSHQFCSADRNNGPTPTALNFLSA